MDLSVIIVSHKAKEEMRVTLDAVFGSQTQYSYEVIVVDNASGDGTVEMIKADYLSRPDIASKLTLIENENEGFSAGNNRGLKIATGDYILFLNPDTKVAPDNFQVMIDFMKAHPEVGLASCKLLKANGEIDWASRRTEPNPKVAFYRLSGLQYLFPKKFGAYNVLHKDVDESTEVDAIVGAYMIMPRTVYEKVGGWDEDFFAYGEDLDLCRRVREGGYKIWYYPKTYSYHFKGQTSKKVSKFALYHFHNAMWIYYKKHYQAQSNFLMNGLVYLGIWGRYYQKLFFNHFKSNKAISK